MNNGIRHEPLGEMSEATAELVIKGLDKTEGID